ncbi:hypothetical protein HMPREF9065_02070 [Aggregatibacter sp. oral taxon 458 str. W10330]|nr:hypothetical protein HMPREF9065_02070 [Aggregatibacter sp. oral taxon 458 str. W10330]
MLWLAIIAKCGEISPHFFCYSTPSISHYSQWQALNGELNAKL